MKVLFLIDSMTKGGAERVASSLTNYLYEQDYDMSLVTVLNTKVEYELNSNIKFFSLDDDYTNILENNKNSIFKKIKKFYNRIHKLNNIVYNNNPDLVIAFLPRSSFIALFSKIFTHRKTLISIRNNPNVEYSNKLKKYLMKRLYPNADSIVFQTEDAMNYFSENIRKNGVIIPNPINTDFIGEKFKGKRENIIVNVGRLEPQKNQKLLINSFSEVLKKHQDYKLIIYGDGKLKEDLQKQIKEMGIEDKVLLAGKVDNIKDKIINAKMFILSSLYEGMPNSLMEAMALGLPVISTDCPCGGPKFLIKNNINGILIKNNDEKEMVDAIIKIIEDSSFANKLSAEAYKICNELDPKIIFKKWEEIINATVERK